jgi:MFS family permease
MLFGAPLLGYAGDRFGRRRAIIWGTLIYYALATLGMLVAHSGSSHQQALVLCA